MMLPYDGFDDDFDDDYDDEYDDDYDDDFDDDWNGNQAAATLPLQWVTSLAHPLPLASQVNRQYNNDDDTEDDDNDDFDVILNLGPDPGSSIVPGHWTGMNQAKKTLSPFHRCKS